MGAVTSIQHWFWQQAQDRVAAAWTAFEEARDAERLAYEDYMNSLEKEDY